MKKFIIYPILIAAVLIAICVMVDTEKAWIMLFLGMTVLGAANVVLGVFLLYTEWKNS